MELKFVGVLFLLTLIFGVDTLAMLTSMERRRSCVMVYGVTCLWTAILTLGEAGKVLAALVKSNMDVRFNYAILFCVATLASCFLLSKAMEYQETGRAKPCIKCTVLVFDAFAVATFGAGCVAVWQRILAALDTVWGI